MRDRKATQSGYRPLIRSLLIIAGLLGTYVVFQILLALGPDRPTSFHVNNLPDEGWSRTV